MNIWRLDVTFGEETYVVQGHRDPIEDLMLGNNGQFAEVEIQTLVSGPFANSRVVSTVRLRCSQNEGAIQMAQGMAIEKAMDGLNEGWTILQGRIAKGVFPGAAT